MKFEESAKLMFSSNYKDRFKAEFIQIDTRVAKLDAMIRKYMENKLEFTPTCNIELLALQLEYMIKYRTLLITRAQIENINLTSDEECND